MLKGCLKNFRVYYSRQNSISNFLNELKLDAHQENQSNFKHQKNPQNNLQEIFEKYLVKIDSDQMDATELLSSPFISQRNEEIENYKKQIKQKNLIAIDNQKSQFIKEYKKQVDSKYYNLKYFLEFRQNNLQTIQESFKDFFEQFNLDPNIIKNIIQQYNLTPEEILHDKIVHLNYPGSSKGLRPEDDPQKYSEYFFSNISDGYYRFLSQAFEYIKYFSHHEELVENEENYKDKSQQNLFQAFNQDKNYNDYQKQYEQDLQAVKTLLDTKRQYNQFSNYGQIENLDQASNIQTLNFYLPQEMRPKMNHDPLAIDDTSVEKERQYISYYYILYNAHRYQILIDNIGTYCDFLGNFLKKEIEERFNKMYPTLEAYFNLLPEELKKQPFVISTYLNLEKRSFWMDLKSKQRLLNKAAYTIRPMGKYSKIYSELALLGENKEKFTAQDWIEYDMIDDDGISINSPKRIALQNLSEEDRLMDTGKKIDPYTIEDTLPQNPIDFYDNEDGFWDEFIQRKNEKLSKVEIYTQRLFIKH